MRYREVTGDREFLVRMESGADWRTGIERFADDEEIDAAVFYGLGAVRDAELMFYDQDDQEYRLVEFDEPLEVAACMGNVSLLDGDRFAHTHAILSRPSGQAVAGHLDGATTFAGELYVREFDEPLVREHDDETGLDLWL